MKILVDESLPTKLAEFFGTEHQVLTVRDMNWLGKKNGELLRLVIENNFEVFVTAASKSSISTKLKSDYFYTFNTLWCKQQAGNLHKLNS